MSLIKMVDGLEVDLTAEEEATVREEWAVNESEANAIKYARDRLDEYPDWRDQLDQIYHEGIDAWKETIKAVKDANPKP